MTDVLELEHREAPALVREVVTVAPEIGEAVKTVADYFGVNPIALVGSILKTKSETRLSIHDVQRGLPQAGITVVNPFARRYIGMALCKRLTSHNISDIARHFGCQRTTAWRAVKKLAPLIAYVEKLMAPDASLDDWARAMVAHYDEVMKH